MSDLNDSWKEELIDKINLKIMISNLELQRYVEEEVNKLELINKVDLSTFTIE